MCAMSEAWHLDQDACELSSAMRGEEKKKKKKKRKCGCDNIIDGVLHCDVFNTMTHG